MKSVEMKWVESLGNTLRVSNNLINFKNDFDENPMKDNQWP